MPFDTVLDAPYSSLANKTHGVCTVRNSRPEIHYTSKELKIMVRFKQEIDSIELLIRVKFLQTQTDHNLQDSYTFCSAESEVDY